MWQIKVNNVLIPIIYWYLSDAILACKVEQNRGCAVITDIIYLD